MIAGRKRFWSEVKVVDLPGGFGLTLDDRPVATPAKSPLIMPNAALARAVAEEWRDVEDEIDPSLLPFTRLANSAIDKVRDNRKEIVQMLGEYGSTDLVCYRATDPKALVERQAQAWDPLLDWVRRRFGVRLRGIPGVMYKAQDAAGLAVLREHLDQTEDFPLMGLHDLVVLSGSLVIGLAVYEGHQSVDAAWALSRIDEIWQAERWGTDDEAVLAEAAKRRDFETAGRFLELSRQ